MMYVPHLEAALQRSAVRRRDPSCLAMTVDNQGGRLSMNDDVRKSSCPESQRHLMVHGEVSSCLEAMGTKVGDAWEGLELFEAIIPSGHTSR